jgi:hypothetical protein
VRRIGPVASSLAALALVLGACGGDDDDDGADTPAVASTAPDDTVDAAGDDTADDEADDTADDEGDDNADDEGGATIDACSLLSDEEAAEALGGPIVERGPTSGVGESVCGWETEGDWSVTVSVGSPGTAAGDEFEPPHLFGGEAQPVPGLEDAFDVGLGTVDFAAAGRHNSVQVVTPTADGGDVEAAGRLAGVLQERIAAAG